MKYPQSIVGLLLQENYEVMQTLVQELRGHVAKIVQGEQLQLSQVKN